MKPLKKKFVNPLIPINLQFFSEGDGGEGATPPQDPPAIQTPPADPPSQDPPLGEGGEKNDQLNEEEIRKLHEAKLLKDLGVDNFDNLKKSLSDYKEYQDSLKTEKQKQNERMQELEQTLQSKDSEVFTLNAKVAAMSNGVQADALEDVITLAKGLVSDEVDIQVAIGRVVEKYPQFKETKQDKPKPNFVANPQHQRTEQTDLDKWKDAFK
ncbi:hypothetical protein H1D32_13335 [Anaerobacillus sp. CMMVII]|uniref:hypothetical protein n=1 Tax=Anaerobacillus sp. CMMVII TaxID=2755588 RepID=UPI0021B71B33|nr:hypothetical protein [Anaerobacillus sp. CMMVII]MCT8138637.1 hypothetical protein [Anaerobacillus sp. CMMVII]